MANIIKIEIDEPSDVKYINLDNLVAVAPGHLGRAKLFMSDGKTYSTFCSFEEFLQILQSRGLLDCE